jgi:hypothetical protein
MVCKPITQKAKNSPFKMNSALVQNDAQIHRGFVDVAGAMGDGMDEVQKRINASEKKQQKPVIDPFPKTYGLEQDVKAEGNSNTAADTKKSAGDKLSKKGK